MLSDAGYDVWLGNNRGNLYSQRHVNLETDTREYWNFTADSYAKYDNPAFIDYILQNTGENELFYVGYSISTWSFWAMMNYYPSYNTKVRLMVAMAPISTRMYYRSFAKKMVPIRVPLHRLAEFFGMYETMPYDPKNGRIGKIFCNKYAPTKPICAILFFMYAGWDPKQLDKQLQLQLTVFSFIPRRLSLQRCLRLRLLRLPPGLLCLRVRLLSGLLRLRLRLTPGLLRLRLRLTPGLLRVRLRQTPGQLSLGGGGALGLFRLELAKCSPAAGFTETGGRRAEARLAPRPIGDRRPAPANLPALCPELRARLAAEGIEQVFLVQVTVLPELLAAAESPLPPADLCVSAPAGRGKTLAFMLPLVQARRRGAPAAGAEGFSLAHLRYLVIDEADRVIEMAETGWLKAVERVAAATARRPASPAG
ncbi:Lipase 3 [Amphibalanus amphitrite]|uniref:Lipase 3 n=1 Tax=Amphibalanus amphitrite TaxID=1232801 RepID=A0A6A4W6Y7_AMPAM|nr:Lipase 3 [Amphibalanus amphitrite]